MWKLKWTVCCVAVGAIAALTAAGAGAREQARPVGLIERILQAQGTVSNGVLQISTDLKGANVHIHGVKILPSFELSSDLDFQFEKNGKVLFNGDVPVRSADMNHVIDAIIGNHLTFQAEHQHFYDFSPIVWFVHFRGVSDGAGIATAVHNVLLADHMPLPQKPPAKPRTPFHWREIKAILGASSATTDSDGVVTFLVDRKNPIDLAGMRVKNETNVGTAIAFEPLNKSGTRAAAAPDFGMVGTEIQRVVATMRAQGWDIGCLYNQETNESPQLYFSHEFKTGDPIELAREIRKGLDQMNVS